MFEHWLPVRTLVRGSGIAHSNSHDCHSSKLRHAKMQHATDTIEHRRSVQYRSARTVRALNGTPLSLAAHLHVHLSAADETYMSVTCVHTHTHILTHEACQ